MKKNLNVGLIGYGFMGRTHSNAYRKVSNFFDQDYKPVLKAVCGRDAAKVKPFADQWGYLASIPRMESAAVENIVRKAERAGNLGGHPKSGQWWSPQNRPIESSQDKGSYSASAGGSARSILGGFCVFRGLVAN